MESEGNARPKRQKDCRMQILRRWCWIALIVASIFPVSGCQPNSQPMKETATEAAEGASPQIRIIKNDLINRDNFYMVRGVVYNPNTKAVKNVAIRYYIWKKWMGQKDQGIVIRDTGGLVRAVINYMPPKSSVEFVATGGDNAPVMSVQSGLLPDELQAEISAQWDE